ncbi:hypothetical protein [Bradyrhizobium valentinum]|uniref:Uncharacterized protein n=1 Tax=Bradyrhizobium valentinum TaxID=1518501 RepID=A0A0R3L2P7_9BRAD|nr:hypothetical protein [Bradyrhizobium valentinum]KRQ99311.1 hypothetical protein CP49_12000 [Bradyrhizobium valentinum]
MTEMDPDDATRAASALVEKIKPILAGQNPGVVGAALGELLAIFVASHAPELREASFKLLLEVSENLTPLVIEEMIDEGRVPPEWREVTKL